ncbi:MAG: carboxypeptidase M32, partial [Bacteroidota bacterium]
MNVNYNRYVSLMRKISDINGSMAVLSWDQEVYMPAKGAEIRAQQVATLSGIAHELFVGNEVGDLLELLRKDDSLDVHQKKNISETLYDYTRRKKYSTEFVMKLSECTSQAFQAWSKAKDTSDFSLFAPHLKKVVQLKREECELLGYESHPYNALLDLYERGAKVADLDILFNDVKSQLLPFIKQIAEQPTIDSAFLFKHYDKDKQWAFGIDCLKQMNYDFEAGRQDISSHPFTISFNPNDVRVTTRVNENDFREMIWSCIHEGGHALY